MFSFCLFLLSWLENDDDEDDDATYDELEEDRYSTVTNNPYYCGDEEAAIATVTLVDNTYYDDGVDEAMDVQVTENPYYGGEVDLDQIKPKKGPKVDFKNTETVTNTENIYYEL